MQQPEKVRKLTKVIRTPLRNGCAKVYSRDVDGWCLIRLSLVLEVVSVHCSVSGRFEAYFRFEPDCNVHTNLQATFSKIWRLLESCKHGTLNNQRNASQTLTNSN